MEKLWEILNKCKLQMKYTQCDNVKEKIALQATCKEERKGIEFKFTNPDTPKQNGLMEQESPTIMGRTWAMMN